jgi:hypothetical protein
MNDIRDLDSATVILFQPMLKSFICIRLRYFKALREGSRDIFPVPAEMENFLGVLTGKSAFLLGHIARSFLLGPLVDQLFLL